MEQEDTLALCVARSTSTLMTSWTEGQTNVQTRRETNQHGRTLGRVGTGNLGPSALLNTTAKINIIKNIIKSWQPRCLSLKGKITVIKSLMIPHLLQLSSVITIIKKVISELEALFINFVWSNRKHLVSKETLILPSELGGMKMPSVKYTIETAKIMWIKRLCNTIPAKWKILSAALM